MKPVAEQQHTLEELRLRDRRKDTFLTVVAHELRSPLAPIANALDVLTIHCESDEVSAHAHAIIRRQLKRLGRLIDDLLDLGRIVHGGISLQKQTIDLATVVAEALETVRPLMELNSHELTMGLPANGLLIEADPARIAQVLVNLLTNAIKYTPPGGTIDITLSHIDGWACMRVLDTGVGIAPEVLPNLFEMFSRFEAPQGPDGLGIGLAIARQLVELHGGTISAHSAGRGLGSEFVVRLPQGRKGEITATSLD